MVHISSYVFFDIETTGLPWQERNRTKITELSFIAVAREDLHKSTGRIPPVSKLSLLLNPERKINPEVSAMTGLTNKFLIHAPTFARVSCTMMSFLNDLPKPICFVAHNGNIFDYKIFLTECKDAKINIPDSIYCVDSLVLFRKILKTPASKTNMKSFDEDLWPELNVTPEDWEEIDKLCSPRKQPRNSLTADLEALEITDDEDSDFDQKNIPCDEINSNKTKVLNNLFNNRSKGKIDCNKVTDGPSKQSKTEGRQKKGEFTLSGLYERLLNKKFVAHRAENDCFALLECVIAKKDDFLPAADDCCKNLVDIKPLQRS